MTKTGKTHFVTFATSEPPGLPLLALAETFANLAVKEGGVDEAHIYTPQTMEIIGQKWCVTPYGEECKLRTDINPTYHLIGLGAWAFVAILDVLTRRAEPNELVIYHNINIEKYPYYIDRAKNLRRLGEGCLRFFEAANFHGMMTGEKIGCTCKYETLTHAAREWKKYYDGGDLSLLSDAIVTSSYPKDLNDLAHLAMEQFNFISIRNTEASRIFFKMLVKECKMRGKDILSPETEYPPETPQPHGVEHFRHTADQAVYNAFAAQNSALTHGIKNVEWRKAFGKNPPIPFCSFRANITILLNFYEGVLFRGQRLLAIGKENESKPERQRLVSSDEICEVSWNLNDSEKAVFTICSSESKILYQKSIYIPSAVSNPAEDKYVTLEDSGLAVVCISTKGIVTFRDFFIEFNENSHPPLFMEVQNTGALVIYSTALQVLWSFKNEF